MNDIEKQAKKVMDDFLKELGGMKEPKDFGLQRKQQMRKPKQKENDPQFRQFLFENAPKVKDDQLVMEKKQW